MESQSSNGLPDSCDGANVDGEPEPAWRLDNNHVAQFHARLDGWVASVCFAAKIGPVHVSPFVKRDHKGRGHNVGVVDDALPPLYNSHDVGSRDVVYHSMHGLENRHRDAVVFAQQVDQNRHWRQGVRIGDPALILFVCKNSRECLQCVCESGILCEWNGKGVGCTVAVESRSDCEDPSLHGVAKLVYCAPGPHREKLWRCFGIGACDEYRGAFAASDCAASGDAAFVVHDFSACVDFVVRLWPGGLFYVVVSNVRYLGELQRCYSPFNLHPPS